MPLSKFSILLLLLLLLVLWITATGVTNGGDLDDDTDLDELLAIDDAEEDNNSQPVKFSSEADVARRAQRIVTELNSDNANKIIDGYDVVLLLGYTPWDSRSAELMPRFGEAALKLKELGSGVVMAKIDAERYPKAAAGLGIKGFPSMLLFVNGTANVYTGGFTAEQIVVWVRKKTGAPVVRLTSVVAAEEFHEKHKTLVVGFFQKFEGREYEEFVKAAITNNEIQFLEVNHIDIAKVLFPGIGNEECFIGLVKSEAEKFERFEDIVEEEKILQFVEYNKFPLVTTLTELDYAIVISSPITLQVFVFAEVDEFSNLKLKIQEVARNYKAKIMFIYVDSAEDNLARPFLTLFGLEPDKATVVAFDNKIGSKYLLESNFTTESLEKFCSQLLDGSLPEYFKSEPVPNEVGPVEKVVGRTFESSVLHSSKSVFLEVYTPWCIECNATSKLVERLATRFKGLKTLKFARIDSSVNEHPKLQVDNYPTLLFYPAGNKENPIKVSKKSSLQELIQFIKENTKVSDDSGVSATHQPNKDEL